MAGKYLLILIYIALLSSCAQIGTITGGDKDITAPIPDLENSSPPNKTLDFQGNSIEILFNEFIKLNNPAQTIKMVPPHATIEAEVKGKALILKWKDSLRDNTTYAIYLNQAVKDVTEGNDSLIQFVFSTGSQLDSLSYSCRVIDAENYNAVENCLVALFNPSSGELMNLIKSEKSGLAELKYVQPGEYVIRAFIDENQNLKIDKSERVAFKEDETITINSSVFDSIPFRLFTPNPKPAIRTAKYIAPGSFIIGTNIPPVNPEFSYNGELLDSSKIRVYARDSFQIFLSKEKISSGTIKINAENFTDSVKMLVLENQKQKPIDLKSMSRNNQLFPDGIIYLEANDLISSIDTTQVQIINLSDSSSNEIQFLNFEKNRIYFQIKDRSVEKVKLTIPKGIILFQNGTNEFFEVEFTLNPEKKFGNLIVVAPHYDSTGIIRLLSAGKILEERKLTVKSDKVEFKYLNPGEYTIEVLLDENDNGFWDTGDLENRVHPEKIDHYPTPVKVRANWEISTTLTPEGKK